MKFQLMHEYSLSSREVLVVTVVVNGKGPCLRKARGATATAPAPIFHFTSTQGAFRQAEKEMCYKLIFMQRHCIPPVS